MNKRINILIFCLLCLGFIGCDQATKGWARSYLDNREPISIFHDTIRLIYVENTGAFMSWGAEWSQNLSFWVLTILPIALLFGFLYFVLKKWNQISLLQVISFCMIFSGGLGNVIARIVRHGHVADLINVADLYVTLGVTLFTFSSLKPIQKSADQDLL